jgi:predicted lipoprotein with Yx(FWY)xxD motif
MNTKPLIATGIVAGFACNLAIAQVAERAGLITNAEGRTLYTFDKDSAGRSVCNGSCAVAWPPFMAQDGASGNGRFTIVIRDDGSRQWALDGKPLYYFMADARPGDASGNGQGGVWHVIKHAATKPAKSPSSIFGAHVRDPYAYSGN